MTSPYQAAFGYLYPRPLVMPSFVRPSDLMKPIITPHAEEETKPCLAPTAPCSIPSAEIVKTSPERKSSQRRPPARGRWGHVKSKITPEETKRYLERKKEREKLRRRLEEEKEINEMSKCTFRPKITEYRPRY
jgi:hypothetical protein